MNPDLIVLITFYLILALLALWWSVKSVQHHIDQAINLGRRQRNEDLLRLRDWLVVEIRSLRRQ
jgi:hypothetical protein